MREEEKGNINELRKDPLVIQAIINADQFRNTVDIALDHFSINYGEKITAR